MKERDGEVPTTVTIQQKNEAEHLRLGVRGGWIEVDEAVAWADRRIARAGCSIF